MRNTNRVLAAAGPLLPFVAAACSTLPFEYRPSGGGTIPDRGTTVSVGDVSAEGPFSEANRIRFNATLDRPVAQAVREALVAELTQAGFRVGTGPNVVTAVARNVAMDRDDQAVVFTIAAKSDGRTLYRRAIPAPLHMNTIFDSKGFADSIRACVEQFVRDADALAALSSGGSAPAPESAGRAAPPAAGDGKPWWQ